MAILPIDSGRYGSKEIKQIFEEEKRLQYQLDFEASVATAQAQIKMIPADASKEIVKATKSGRVRLERIRELEAISEHDTAALVEALSEQCSAKAKPWIHYGLTSNDVVDTSTSMQMKDAFNIIESKILNLATVLIDRAVYYKSITSFGR
jgi:adenylosuccinate lyase